MAVGDLDDVAALAGAFLGGTQDDPHDQASTVSAPGSTVASAAVSATGDAGAAAAASERYDSRRPPPSSPRRPPPSSSRSRGGRPARVCDTRLVYGSSAISRAF